MASTQSPYDIQYLIDVLENTSRAHVRQVLEKYLRAKAHPYYLKVVAELRALKLDRKQGTAFQELVNEVLRPHLRKFSAVPEMSLSGREGPVSRLYDDILPRKVDTGILYGASIETYVLLWTEISNGTCEERQWREKCGKVYKRIIMHPQADTNLLSHVASQIMSLCTLVQGRYGEVHPASFITLELDNIASPFYRHQIRKHSVEVVTRNFLESWKIEGSPDVILEHTLRSWVLLSQLAEVLRTTKDVDMPATRFLGAVFKSAQGNTPDSESARHFLTILPLGKLPLQWSKETSVALKLKTIDVTISATLSVLFDALKRDLPNIITYHTIIHWIQEVAAESRERLVLNLMYSSQEATETWTIDKRVETLVQDVLGQEGWKALCAFQDPKFWNAKDEIANMQLRAELDESTPEFATFRESLRRPVFRTHDASAAVLLDGSLADMNATLDEADTMAKFLLQLLSGEMLATVTHLRTAWMPVSRHKEEYLGKLMRKIEVAAHPQLGNNGAACRFRIHLHAPQPYVIAGTLDAEGEVTLENIHFLSTLGRHALRTAVLDTMSAVLVPRHTERLPGNGGAGPRLSFASQVWASRPQINIVGVLPQGKNGESQDSPAKRIHPVIATLVFRWLLDEQLDWPFQLYAQREVEVDEVTELHWCKWPEAKDLLIAGKITLSEVFIKTVKSHTQPLKVYIDEGRVVKKEKMSERAKRNYKHFRSEGGRELDFSPIPKTYTLPGDIKLPEEVPRTFNQGAFNTLAEVLELVPDLQLKQKVLRTFAEDTQAL